MKTVFFMLAILCIGGLMPIQGSINAQIGQILGHPLRGTLMNFVTGGVLLVVLLCFWVGFPTGEDMMQAPWYLYSGGLMGVLFVTAMLTLIPELGALRVVAAVVVGQLIVSTIIDHFGLLKVPVHSLSVTRVAGIGCLVIGLYLVNR